MALPPMSAGALAQETTSGLDAIVVTASRENLIGTADSASQGSVTREELALRPVYRVGQLLEAAPGLVVTVHSGEGKAYQYLLRGENLDHGIDLANFIDGMPVNRPTNAHGQGYTDLNFVIPEILDGITYTKGPFYPEIGDFGAVGSVHMKMRDDLPLQASVSAGTLGDEEAFTGGTYHFDNGGRLLGALDYSHVDGPLTNPDNFRKIAAAVRYSQGSAEDGYSLTGLYYKGQGRFTTDQPRRAVDEGLIDRFGSLDPSDGTRNERFSLSGRYGITGDDWRLSAGAYAIHSTQTLWNNFTHFLNDPINGDQEQQDETRTTFGGDAALSRDLAPMGFATTVTVGLQDRYDDIYVDRRHTRNRLVLPSCNDGMGDFSAGLHVCTADRAKVNDAALYGQIKTRWTDWLRTDVGLREDYSYAHDRPLIDGFIRGTDDQYLLQPKGSIVFGPWHDTEFYVDAGKGFHSDDIRGVQGTVPALGTRLAVGSVPLLAKTHSEEIGLRNASIPGLDVQIAAFRQDFSSEQIYNQDAGMDQATAPSRRQGFEISAQYHPFPWMEVNGDFAATHARLFKNAGDLTNISGITGGRSIGNAPDFIASFGVLVDNLGPWFGGLEERILGPYPLVDGPRSPGSDGYRETNIDIGYHLTQKVTVKMAIYNLLDSRADSSEFYYATNINQREVAANGALGVSDYQFHPLEPISVRITVTATF